MKLADAPPSTSACGPNCATCGGTGAVGSWNSFGGGVHVVDFWDEQPCPEAEDREAYMRARAASPSETAEDGEGF